MTENYIFDFGNVLTEFYPYKLTEPYVSDEEMKKRISQVVFHRECWDKLDAGTISNDEMKSFIKSNLSSDEADIGCKVYDNWVSNLTPVKDMQQLIFDIHNSGKKLYLLSNISIYFADNYHKVKWIKELFDCFDGIVLSGPVGKTKPNRDIFEYILDKYNLDARECLFIDDSNINIAGGEALGIKGYLFDGDAKRLREYIGI